jgi:hypothetical protein
LSNGNVILQRHAQPTNDGRSTDSSKLNTEIPLRKEAGTLVVPVKINNALTLNFTVDSGAADVSIPADVTAAPEYLSFLKDYPGPSP